MSCRPTTVTTDRCCARWCAPVRSSDASPSTLRAERHADAVAELPMDAHKLSRGEPAIPTEYLGRTV